MRKCDGYAYILNALYWRGKSKTMFSPILEVTSIQDGGALAEKVYDLLNDASFAMVHALAVYQDPTSCSKVSHCVLIKELETAPMLPYKESQLNVAVMHVRAISSRRNVW